LPNLGEQNSYRTTGSVSLRSTLTTEHGQRVQGRLAVVAERLLRQRDADMFDDMGGYALVMPLGTDIRHVRTPRRATPRRGASATT
jgi:hypothetical protein